MTRKSFVELEAQADATIEDNTTGSISPADVRAMFKDFLNAIRPAYSILQQTGNPTQNLGLTPVKMLWNNRNDSDPNQTSSSAANGSISRLERGTSTISFSVDVECASGRFITATLYKNGVATTWRITGVGAGNGNPVGISMTAIDYADPAAYYELFLSAEQANTATIVSNGTFVLAVDPVNSYI
jgi:hypothetical protein